MATRTERHTLKGHKAPIQSLAFSPDGKTLAVNSGGVGFVYAFIKEVKLWDVLTGRERCVLKEQGSSMALSADGKILATGLGANVSLWDVSEVMAVPPIPQTQSRAQQQYAAWQAAEEADKYFAQGEYDEAVPLYERWLRVTDITRFEIPKFRHAVGVKLLRLAESYGRLGDDRKSDDVLRRFLDLHRPLDPRDVELTTARNLNASGNKDYTNGKHLVATTSYAQALGTYRFELGWEHPYVATCLENLATATALGDLRVAALWFYREALTIREQSQGPTHPDVPAILERYAAELRKAGRTADADKAENRATRIRKR